MLLSIAHRVFTLIPKGPVVIASGRGGMDIEAVAKEEPAAIVTQPIDIKKGETREREREREDRQR